MPLMIKHFKLHTFNLLPVFICVFDDICAICRGTILAKLSLLSLANEADALIVLYCLVKCYNVRYLYQMGPQLVALS